MRLRRVHGEGMHQPHRPRFAGRERDIAMIAAGKAFLRQVDAGNSGLAMRRQLARHSP